MKKLHYAPWTICGEYSGRQARGNHRSLREDGELQVWDREESQEVVQGTKASETKFRNTPVLKTEKVSPKKQPGIAPTLFISGVTINGRTYSPRI